MGTVDLSQYKSLYFDAAKTYVTQLETNLATLDANASDFVALENLHIAFHSLKGQSFAMNFQETAQLCFALERACKKLGEVKLPLTPEDMAALHRGTDTIKKDLSCLEANGHEEQVSEVTQQITAHFAV